VCHHTSTGHYSSSSGGKHVRLFSNAGARIVMAVLELFTFNNAVVNTLVHCEMFL